MSSPMSLKVPLFVASESSSTVWLPPVSVTTGATLFTVNVKVSVPVAPSLSVAVIVTTVGPEGPSDGVYDQLQLPDEPASWFIGSYRGSYRYCVITYVTESSIICGL